MDLQQQILQKIEDKIASNQLVLPSMPDIFLQVKKIVDDPNSNTNNIATIITRDPALTARLLKVSNNALYRANHEITNLQQAVSRLGMQLTKTLVTSHAITQMFNQPRGRLKPFFEQLQLHSTNVSAHAFAIAKNFTRIKPDDALLAGLVHNIGYLPMAKCTESFPEVEQDPSLLIEVMGNVHTKVGEMVLNSWGFPKHIIEASIQYVNQFRKGPATVDLTDVIIIASLDTYRGTDHPCTLPDWSQYPAFQKIGINTHDDLVKLDNIHTDIENARIMLGMTVSGVE
jgi:HD-like signal output (HDOD) protein